MKRIVASQHALTDLPRLGFRIAAAAIYMGVTPCYVEEIIRNEHRPVPWGRHVDMVAVKHGHKIPSAVELKRRAILGGLHHAYRLEQAAARPDEVFAHYTHAYATNIRSGNRLPHPRHLCTLAGLVGISGNSIPAKN